MTTWRLWSEPGWWAETITHEDAKTWWRRSRSVIDVDKNHLKFLDGDFEQGCFRVASMLPVGGGAEVRNLVVTIAQETKFHIPPQGERNPEDPTWYKPVPRETTKEIQ